MAAQRRMDEILAAMLELSQQQAARIDDYAASDGVAGYWHMLSR